MGSRLGEKRWQRHGRLSCFPAFDAGFLTLIRDFSLVVLLRAASLMADNRRSGAAPLLDIEKILHEAQHRWLRPTEICEILRNYHKFHIEPEPPNKPTSGSLFLFDRKVLRYFRKDGHNWRKKKDGKTVKEAHEKLKVSYEKLKAGSIDVLHCYYAHGEDKEGFQRRSYWMLEGELMHIVLVHYREVKGSKTSSIQLKEDGETMRNSNLDSAICSNFYTSLNGLPSQVTDYGSLKGTQLSEFEDAYSTYLNRNSMQQILAKQVPDTTLSLRCSSMDIC